MQDGRLNELIIRILVHQHQSVGEGASALTHGLGDGPQPSGVHVGVTHDAHLTVGIAAGLTGEHLAHNLVAAAHTGDDGLVIHHGGMQDSLTEHALQHIDGASLQEGILLDLCHRQQDTQIADEILNLPVAGSHVHVVEGVAIVLVGQILLTGIGMHVALVVPSIALQVDVIGLAGLGLLGQQNAVLQTVVLLDDGAVHTHGLAIHKQETLAQLGVLQDKQLLALQLGGDGIVKLHPQVTKLATPDVTVLDGLVLHVGSLTEVLFGLVTLHLGKGLLGMVHIAGILPGQVLELFEHTIVKALIMHRDSSLSSSAFHGRQTDSTTRFFHFSL